MLLKILVPDKFYQWCFLSTLILDWFKHIAFHLWKELIVCKQTRWWMCCWRSNSLKIIFMFLIIFYRGESFPERGLGSHVLCCCSGVRLVLKAGNPDSAWWKTAFLQREEIQHKGEQIRGCLLNFFQLTIIEVGKKKTDIYIYTFIVYVYYFPSIYIC